MTSKMLLLSVMRWTGICLPARRDVSGLNAMFMSKNSLNTITSPSIEDLTTRRDLDDLKTRGKILVRVIVKKDDMPELSREFVVVGERRVIKADYAKIILFKPLGTNRLAKVDEISRCPIQTTDVR